VVLEANRSGLELIPVTPPWYLDPESGECGPLETGLDDPEAGLLAMAFDPAGCSGCLGRGGADGR
jgi:hypothetical protein